MLNKPKFLSPSINMYGNVVIDLNEDILPFSCVVDGNESVKGWRITISRIEDNTVVFDSGEQMLDSVFIPVDNRNQNKEFTINLKKYLNENISDQYIQNPDIIYNPDKVYYKYIDGMYTIWDYSETYWDSNKAKLYIANFANRDIPYYWDITLIGTTEIRSVSANEVFYANTIPETTISYSYDSSLDSAYEPLQGNNAIFSKRSVFFKADYTQSENIQLKRYGWRLTDTNNDEIIFDTISKNQIYGVDDNIYCECSGLVNHSEYCLELYIETQNGYFNILNTVKFFIDYPIENIDGDFDVFALNDNSAIMLNWGNLKSTEGVVKGSDIDYVQNLPITNYDNDGNITGSVSADIPYDSSIVFDTTANGKGLNLDENSYVVLSTQIKKQRNKVLFEMEGKDAMLNILYRKLEYSVSDNTLKYTVRKGDIIVNKAINISNIYSARCWYVITLYPLLKNDTNYYTDMKVAESNTIDDTSIFPTSNESTNPLYPSTKLYPYGGKWKVREG